MVPSQMAKSEGYSEIIYLERSTTGTWGKWGLQLLLREE
ncbi:MAG: hypothetical protein Ct9H90mP1_2430 [Methanobacteriota archaeon]|nr:MAG: hypothetical protein Ct9H90mP1_2430 [Euryarchaeota archaeon]